MSVLKKLLVLDIDYTIFDHVSHAERGINDKIKVKKFSLLISSLILVYLNKKS
jgi:hypothetical protein